MLTSVYLLSTSPQLLELAKIPMLSEHFKEHKDWDSYVSFMDFMYIHYIQVNNKFGDTERDKQMPFKTPVHSPASSIGFVMSVIDFVIVPKSELIEQKQINIADVSVYYPQYLSSIWRPPKSC